MVMPVPTPTSSTPETAKPEPREKTELPTDSISAPSATISRLLMPPTWKGLPEVPMLPVAQRARSLVPSASEITAPLASVTFPLAWM